MPLFTWPECGIEREIWARCRRWSAVWPRQLRVFDTGCELMSFNDHESRLDLAVLVYHTYCNNARKTRLVLGSFSLLFYVPHICLSTVVHLGFDALLISAFLAGVKRTTGLTCVYPHNGFLRARPLLTDPHSRKSRTKIFGVRPLSPFQYPSCSYASLELLSSYLEFGW